MSSPDDEQTPPSRCFVAPFTSRYVPALIMVPIVNLPDKDPGDELDYQIDFTDFIAAGFDLTLASVEVEAAGNTESPIDLSVADPTVVESTATPPRLTAVKFWVAGGTNNVRYVLKISFGDTQTGSDTRSYVRRASIRVRLQ